MNMKKMKKFFTLSRRAEGFTLVELIVVIAILAILGGVAVPAYSGYVKKANMQADQTLASEVAHALTLAHYSGKLTPGDCVVLQYNAVVVAKNSEDNTAITANDAMVAAFGSGYVDSLKLKYDGWSGNATNIDTGKINASNFGEKNLDTMMGDVSVLSGALAQYLGNGATYKPLQEYMAANNISTADPQAMANLAVLQAANSISGVDSVKFSDAYTTYTGTDLANALQEDNGADLDKMSAYAVAYAQTEGFVNYVCAEAEKSGDATKIAEATKFREEWAASSANVKDVETVDTLIGSTDEKGFKQFNDYYMAYYGGDAVENDAAAFRAYMDSVNEVAPSIYGDVDALTDQNFYKSNTISNMINNYISAAEMLKGYPAGSVVIGYDGTTIFCYPFDFQ